MAWLFLRQNPSTPRLCDRTIFAERLFAKVGIDVLLDSQSLSDLEQTRQSNQQLTVTKNAAKTKWLKRLFDLVDDEERHWTGRNVQHH